ncbi:MAG: class II aldolase/adducin family protein [Clostridia bacterium]
MTRTEAAHALMDAVEFLKRNGLLGRRAHANLSARLGPDTMLLTRGGNVAALTEASFAVVRTDGTVMEGEVDPGNQEIVEMHAGVYRMRPQVGAIIHTHAPHLTAFAIARQPLPLAYEPLLRAGLTEPVPVVPWAPRGSEASVGGILKTAAAHPTVPAVLLANHGVLVYHESPAGTASLLGTLEEAAELSLMAAGVGGAVEFPPEAVSQVKERMAAFHS